MPTTKKNNLLEYKGHPLMRKENIIYYGSMSDSHIIMKERIVKKTEKNSMWAAMDIASIWLGRALHTK